MKFMKNIATLLYFYQIEQIWVIADHVYVFTLLY